MQLLIGGNGYYGRNYQYFLSTKNIPFKIVDRVRLTKDDIVCDFAKISNDYSNVEEDFKLFLELKDRVSAIVNFAAVSFVDYSIEHPDETIENNYSCCVNGLKLANVLNCDNYIYISTDEVNVDKPVAELSPYVISKRNCEKFLKNCEAQALRRENDEYSVDIKIMRPVNLMGTMEPHFETLNQTNPCLLKKIADVISSGQGKVQIHGSGNQRRMFMDMRIACEVLLLFVDDSFEEKILDITEYPEFRTQNLKIKDIVMNLQRKYGFPVEYVEDPRGIYQDDNYLTTLTVREYNGSIQLIKKCLKSMMPKMNKN